MESSKFKSIRKHVNDQFQDPLQRLLWSLFYLTHSWVEAWKIPGLLVGEKTADATKYPLAIGSLLLILVVFERLCSGNWL